MKESLLLIFKLLSHGTGASVTSSSMESLLPGKKNPMRTNPAGSLLPPVQAGRGEQSRETSAVLLSHRSQVRTLLRSICGAGLQHPESLQQQTNIPSKISMKDGTCHGEEAPDCLCWVARDFWLSWLGKPRVSVALERASQG